jgi:hypothetical protein
MNFEVNPSYIHDCTEKRTLIMLIFGIAFQLSDLFSLVEKNANRERKPDSQKAPIFLTFLLSFQNKILITPLKYIFFIYFYHSILMISFTEFYPLTNFKIYIFIYFYHSILIISFTEFYPLKTNFIIHLSRFFKNKKLKITF